MFVLINKKKGKKMSLSRLKMKSRQGGGAVVVTERVHDMRTPREVYTTRRADVDAIANGVRHHASVFIFLLKQCQTL